MVAAFAGAVVGFIVTVIVGGIVLADRMNAPGDSGGTAMGLFFTLGPIGAVVGAIGAALFVAFRRGRAGARSGAIKQALVGLGIVAVLIAGIWHWLFDDGAPPNYADDPNPPQLVFEIVAPAAAVVATDQFEPSLEMESWQHRLYPRELKLERVSDRAALSGKIELFDKVENRVLWFSPAADILVRFELPLAAEPQSEPRFGPWRPADMVDAFNQASPPPRREQFLIRTRVERR